MDWQRIEILVGEKNDIARGPSGIWSMLWDHLTEGGHRGNLICCCSRSAGLASTRCTLIASWKAGRIRIARSASAIMVPRPGPNSMNITCSGMPPHRVPYRCGPQAHQFAEHLADFGRGDEIAVPAEWIALQVITVAADVSDTSAYSAKPASGRFWRSGCISSASGVEFQVTVLARLFACGRGPRRHASTMSTAPAIIIGPQQHSHRSPPHRKPSCGSGSRKNSPIIREIP